MLAQETIGQRLVFAQQTQQQVLRLDVGRTELAGFIACEEDHAPGFFGVPFKHFDSSSPSLAIADRFGEPSCCPNIAAFHACTTGRRTNHQTTFSPNQTIRRKNAVTRLVQPVWP